MTKNALAMWENKKIPVTILRPFTIYGEGQPQRMFMAEAIQSALQNKNFEMTKGTQKRDYLYIEDFIKAIKAAITKTGVEGEVINIGSGKAFQLRKIAAKIWETVGADKSLLKIGARFANDAEVYDTCADISKAAQLLGWQPEISLENGIKLTIEAITNTKLITQ